jgi:hypothetical protein
MLRWAPRSILYLCSRLSFPNRSASHRAKVYTPHRRNLSTFR